jgi:hypothetical protein
MTQMVRKGFAMKKTCVMMMFICFLFSLFTTHDTLAVNDAVKMIVNGKEIKADIAPRIINGRTMIAVRTLTVLVRDMYVQWDERTKTVSVMRLGKNAAVKIKADSLAAEINGKTVKLDAPAKIIAGRTFIPLRFVAEAFGIPVSWRADQNAVALSVPERSQPNINLENLKVDDLTKARSAAIHLEKNYAKTPLEIHTYSVDEEISTTYLFPEGEALRYFMIEGDVISYIQIKDETAQVTWQARLGSIIDADTMDTLIPYLKTATQDAWGERPVINKPLVYFDQIIFGDSLIFIRGKIDVDGKTTVLGEEHLLPGDLKNGQLIEAIPGEKRTDN